MVAQIDSLYRKQGLGKVFRRLVSYGLFEGRPHTTKGQWFNPVVFRFLETIRSFPGNPKIIKPIFITGLGRSGTTILGVLLSLHKEVGFLNEPKAIWRLIDPRHDINGDYILTNGKYHLTHSDVTNKTSTDAHRIFSRYLKIVNSKRLVDKYPELIFRVDYLLEIFPDAKIIFITRNGNDASHSIDLWSKRLGYTKNDIREDWWGRDNIKWHYLYDQIISKDPYFLDILNIPSGEIDHINRAALEWIITMREGKKQQSTHKNSIYTISYEELSSQKYVAMSKLLTWCELESDLSITEYCEKGLYENKPKPHPTLLAPVEHIYTDTMKSLGYYQ